MTTNANWECSSMGHDPASGTKPCRCVQCGEPWAPTPLPAELLNYLTLGPCTTRELVRAMRNVGGFDTDEVREALTALEDEGLVKPVSAFEIPYATLDLDGWALVNP